MQPVRVHITYNYTPLKLLVTLKGEIPTCMSLEADIKIIIFSQLLIMWSNVGSAVIKTFALDIGIRGCRYAKMPQLIE